MCRPSHRALPAAVLVLAWIRGAALAQEYLYQFAAPEVIAGQTEVRPLLYHLDQMGAQAWQVLVASELDCAISGALSQERRRRGLPCASR